MTPEKTGQAAGAPEMCSSAYERLWAQLHPGHREELTDGCPVWTGLM